MDTTAEVVIVGGGIIGASIAYHLAQKGTRNVVLLEKDMLGDGTTAKCAGGIRVQFSTEINIRFSLESFKTWNNFHEIMGSDLDFKKVGYLLLATTELEWAAFQSASDLQKGFGIPVELLSPEDIRDRWPYIRTDDLRGGTFCCWEGHAGPYEALTGFVRGARRCGVRVLENAEVTQILRNGSRVTGVRTRRGDISAPVVVNAAGPYAGEVGKMAGVEVPVKPYRRQLFLTRPFHQIPESLPMVIDFHQGWYFRKEGARLLISGPKDTLPSFDQSMEYNCLEEVAEKSIQRAPCLEDAEISGGWAGTYEISPDNHAILGGVPGLDGFFVAGGFSGHGFQHSPAAGKVMAELILGEQPSIDISSLALDRFEKDRMIPEFLTAFHE